MLLLLLLLQWIPDWLQNPQGALHLPVIPTPGAFVILYWSLEALHSLSAHIYMQGKHTPNLTQNKEKYVTNMFHFYRKDCLLGQMSNHSDSEGIALIMV